MGEERVWRAGVARAVITPPIGSPLIGFAGRGDSTACHDELSATALVLECGATRTVLIACDLLYIRGGGRIRQLVATGSGIPLERVLLTASHNHYGPPVDPGAEGPTQVLDDTTRAIVDAYWPNLAHTLTGAVLAASRRLEPCTFGWAAGNAFIGINRRERLPDGRIVLGNNPDGPCDRTVRLLRIDHTDGRPLALLCNFACHAVSLGSECTEITADFPAVARELVERETGAACLFLQGAAGNINPVLMGWDWTYPRRLGLSLGAEAARLYFSAAPEPPDAALATASSVAELQPYLPDSVEAAHELIGTLEADLETAAGGGRSWTSWRLERARRGLEVLTGNAAPVPVRAELSALALGSSIGLVTSPGEMFTELGSAIVEQSPFARTLYAGYTHDAIGYVPTPAAYDEGGYEVTHSCYVARGSSAVLEQRSLDLLESVQTPAAAAATS